MRELEPFLDPRVDRGWVRVLIRKYGNHKFDQGRNITREEDYNGLRS